MVTSTRLCQRLARVLEHRCDPSCYPQPFALLSLFSPCLNLSACMRGPAWQLPFRLCSPSGNCGASIRMRPGASAFQEARWERCSSSLRRRCFLHGPCSTAMSARERGAGSTWLRDRWHTYGSGIAEAAERPGHPERLLNRERPSGSHPINFPKKERREEVSLPAFVFPRNSNLGTLFPFAQTSQSTD